MRDRRLYWVIGGGVLGYLLLTVVAATLFFRHGCVGGGGGGGGRAGDGAGAADQGDPYAGRRGVHAGGGGSGGDSSSSTPGEGTVSEVSEPETSSPDTTTNTGDGAQSEPSTLAKLPSTPLVAHLADIASSGVPGTETARRDAQVLRRSGGASGGGSGTGPYSQRGSGSGPRGAGATPESEAAVEAGLRWLVLVQHPDGHWDENIDLKSRGKDCPRGTHSTGLTALAVLAFLGAGHVPYECGREGKIGSSKTVPAEGPHSEVVRRALAWLLTQQSLAPSPSTAPSPVRRGIPSKGAAAGAVEAGRFAQETFYEQGLATMALCEAYGMTLVPEYGEPAQRALDCIVRNIGEKGGYGYSGPGDDVHVTSFQVMALKSGKLAGLNVPQETMNRLLAYYYKALHEDGTTGYSSADRSGSREGARTAVGLFCRIFLGRGLKDPNVRRIADLVRSVGPRIDDIFQTYYGTYAMFQIGDAYWKEWNRNFSGPVIARQVQTPDELKGSWAGRGRDPVCSTCFYIMALEVYYRFLPVNK